MTPSKIAVLTGAFALISSSAFAQLPSSKVLTLDVAQAIAQETMAKCRVDGYKVTVLVVDGMNATKAMLRDDGATAATAEVAKMKATAAMLYNRPSGPAQPLPAGTTAPPATIPGTINARCGQWRPRRRQRRRLRNRGTRQARRPLEIATEGVFFYGPGGLTGPF